MPAVQAEVEYEMPLKDSGEPVLETAPPRAQNKNQKINDDDNDDDDNDDDNDNYEDGDNDSYDKENAKNHEQKSSISGNNGNDKKRSTRIDDRRRMSLFKVEELEELERESSTELEMIKDAFAHENAAKRRTSSRDFVLNGNGNGMGNNNNNNNNMMYTRHIEMSMQSQDSLFEGESMHESNLGTDIDAPGTFGSELAGKETKAVHTLKIILFIILLLSAVVVATFVFLYTSRDEQDEFTESFTEFSNLLIDSIQGGAQNRLEAIAALASQFQAYAITSNSTWPFVTVPFYEEQVDVMKSLTAAYGVLLFPVVLDSQREEWETYSVQNVGWINASFETQRQIYGEADQPFPEEGESWFDVLWGDDYLDPNNPDFSSGIGSKIFRTSDLYDPDFHNPYIHETTSVYFPQWQVAPMSWYYQTTVNSNYGQWDDFYNSTVISIQTGHSVLGIAWTDGNAPGRITTMLYPIFNEFHSKDRKVVAFLGADIFWQDYLKDILPENAKGLYVVIENTVGQAFTYELFGEDVVYIGYEDLHEPEYDDMVQTMLFGEHLQEPLPSGATYSGAPLHEGFIQYTMKIYPSKELEDAYITNRPVSYTILACLIFLFTSLIFILYDCLVERRQKLVLETAIQSDAIVSSLFPNNVKNRLYNASPEDIEGSMRHLHDAANYGNAPDNNNDNLQYNQNHEQKEEPEVVEEYELPMRNRFSTSRRNIESHITPTKQKEAPIAEFYETSTILFADIAGFTAWSSDRPPADVFTLLETIYGKFDKSAKKRNVFKVETIGDCYVAVAGVPERRYDHVINMTKFARDMLRILQTELVKLESVLGEGTSNLAMRVGLHSGPVTAGVLRGERARFQLFGDSVNTAARMESNGERNKIHVSEATAQLLRDLNKESWLIKREKKIVAKGKGEMQTYWIRITQTRSEASFVNRDEETEASD